MGTVALGAADATTGVVKRRSNTPQDVTIEGLGLPQSHLGVLMNSRERMNGIKLGARERFLVRPLTFMTMMRILILGLDDVKWEWS